MLVQFVKFKSGLSDAEVRQTMEGRAPQFRALPGLLQKYYVRENETGEYAGIYFWDSEESMREFRQSELARTIPIVYKAVGQPRVEVLEMVLALRPEERAVK
ncbi:MAG: YdhR family protein [Nitrospinota bacterium]